jgi:hypothetical protein
MIENGEATQEEICRNFWPSGCCGCMAACAGWHRGRSPASRFQFASSAAKNCNGMPEFCSGDVVELRHQGRLANVAQVFDRRLRQGEPIMPISQSVLDALHLGDKPHSFP